MVIQNIKDNHKGSRGFTIVELLIVIVVIGILAAITLISYNGITNRANASKAISNAEMVQKKAEAFNADPQVSGATVLVSGNGYYPASAAVFNAIPSSALGFPGVTLLANSASSTAAAGSATTFALAATSSGSPTSTNATTAVQYIACGSAADGVSATGATAYFIGYYDQSKSAVVWIGSSNVVAVPATLSALTTTPASYCPAGATTLSTH